MNPSDMPKLLYIDDTPSARTLVVRLLSAEYRVLEASEPLAGIELAIETQPDLILLDINLPQLSGREVAARLKTILPNTPLVAFSADVSPGARERALAAGCIGYLTKPLDVDLFPAQIAEFLRGKREVLSDEAAHKQAFSAELAQRLEEKVRELTKTAERNAFLNEQNQRLVKVLQRRQHLLEAAARVGQIITSILDIDELLQVTVDVICEEYEFYYAAIFLLDASGEWAVLHAGHGAAGRAMLTAGHKLAVGGQSMIGTAIRQRQARIALDVGTEKTHFKNPYLRDTQSEMALPLIVKAVALGALSVQSREVNAFGDDDITALQTLANQVGIAINNARLLRDLDQANHELLRNKTFEAIATATGEAIHWVGNKAAPIPSSARRVREDLAQFLAMTQALLNAPAEQRAAHPFWPMVAASFAAAAPAGLELAALAHDLGQRTPKQLSRLGGLESILEDLTIIEKSAQTILNIKEDLIGPVRLQKVTELQLPQLLDQTIFEMALPLGVVSTQYAPDTPPARGDARQISQVFNNLIKNAWEAMFKMPDPRIWVVTEAAEAHGKRYATTQVRDNGPGIPPDLIEKIWVSFFTTKGERGGTGLGLSACMAMVTQAEGKITVDSEVGVGTTFTVWLPAAR
jgi:signal transduction histidine kinase/CheY-like chemotaxis protein